MVRQTDRLSTLKRDRSGPAARRGGEKTDKTPAPVLCGWNLPVLPDDDGIMIWMKREKNGDNNRKKVNEVYEEERYRHVQGHCNAIENKLLFDRQSLHDRYLKNCQFGVRDSRATKDTPMTPIQPTRSARVNRPPSQEAERNCFSAGAVADENETIEEGEEMEELGEVVRGVSRGRSHSAVCHSASLRAYGMTLPESRRVPIEGDEVKDEGEDPAWDEGYGSKVSSNDQEQDGMEEEGGKGVAEGGGVQRLQESGSQFTVHKVGPVLQPGHVQPLSHQDAMAKLMYSRRERTVYERLPSRRMRGNSFWYAGREQSRLTEASLSHITPAYLARYHHLADLANMAQAKHMQHGKQKELGGAEAAAVQQQEEGESGEGGSGGSLQPRTLVLRKITIQDSGKELFSQNIQPAQGSASGNSSPAKSSPALNQPSDKVRRRQGLLSPPRTHSERSVSETKLSEISLSGSSEMTRSGLSEQVSVRVQDMTPELMSCDTSSTLVTTTSSTLTQHKSALSVPAYGEDHQQGSSPMLTLSGPSPSSERLTMSTFAVTDLLPAVERNIRYQRSTQRGLSKSKTMDVSLTLSNLNSRRQQQQQQQQHHQQHHQQYNKPQTSEVAMTVVHEGSGREDASAAAGKALPKKTGKEDVRGFPGFRPHNNISPLQRAKEIANRRLHGHVTKLPDGSETVRVTSPRYASRAEQQGNHSRAKSASRFPPLLRQRHHASACDLPTATLSKSPRHSTLATTLSKSHSTLFTREDMAARLD